MRKHTVRNVRKWFIIIINILCIVAILAILLTYTQVYNDRLYAQNVTDINNLNRSAATISEEYFKVNSEHLNDMAYYIQSNNFTLEEAMEYIYSSNQHAEGAYQLVGSDFTGYLTRLETDGSYVSVEYTDSQYDDLQKIFSNAAKQREIKIAFTPEFTDDYTAVKSFALYTPVALRAEDGHSRWMTLMAVSYSKTILNSIQSEAGYTDMSTVLMDENGNYIISSASFSSNNFFKYLYVCNDLSLDEEKALKEAVNQDDSGYFIYKNMEQKNSVFTYVKLKDSSWYCVSMVPLSSFHNVNIDFRFTIFAIIILCFMLIFDVAFLNRSNRQLKISMQKEKKANEAKSDFLSRMSHDIRTPMNGILGLSQLGQEETTDPDSKEYFEKISSSGGYLLGLLNDILDMSRIENGRVEFHEEAVDAGEFIDGIMQLIQPLAQERNITIVRECDPIEVGYLCCDKVRMQQIYVNLLSNAIKFSEPGSSVEWIMHCHRQNDGTYYFEQTIEDHGCGMSEDFLKRIFHPFEQEYNKYSGETASTGLGLAICKNLIDQLGGSITVESQLGKGSKFTVCISHKVAEAPEMDGVAKQNGRLEVLSGKRVLLAEDHPLNTEIARKLLQKKGMIVECAGNGKIAVDLFEQSPLEYYQVILMDMMMPVMGGLEAAKTIRSLPREDAATIPIIAMTANAYEEDRKKSKEAGMNAHLAKPVDAANLYETLAQFCAKKI